MMCANIPNDADLCFLGCRVRKPPLVPAIVLCAIQTDARLPLTTLLHAV